MDIGENIDYAVENQNIESLKELMQEDPLEIWSDGRYLDDIAETCNIKLLQAVLETWPYPTPINLIGRFELDPLLRIAFGWHTKDQAKMLKMVKFLMPLTYNQDPERPGCYSLKDFFPALAAHCAEGRFHVTEFLIHKLYSENNSLYPLIKRFEAFDEYYHDICIFLHDEIDSVMECFEYVKEIMDQFDFYSSEHFGPGLFVQTFLKLLAKDTRESMQLAVETLHVLLDKNLFELAEEWMDVTFRSSSKDYFDFNDYYLEIQYEVPLLPMFQFLFNSINGKTQTKIYAIISEWFKCPPTNNSYVKIFKQSKEFMRPFISKPLDQKLHENARQNLAPSTDVEKVSSLKEVCRDFIRCKIFEQIDDVKEFMKRIWTLQLPLTVKCFLLHVPDPAWMKNLQI